MGRRTEFMDDVRKPDDKPEGATCVQCNTYQKWSELFWNIKRGHHLDWVKDKGEYRCRDSKSCRRRRRKLL